MNVRILSMTTYPLSKIIFKTHEITSVQSRVCPRCLTENLIENKNCTYCDLNIPNYTEDNFILERLKCITDEVKSEIGLSEFNSTDKQKQIEKFRFQYELWDDRIVKTAKFLNRFTMSPINVLDFAKMFLENFPFSSSMLEKIQLGKIDLKLMTLNSSEIQKKLVDIAHRCDAPTFEDFALWSQYYLNESNYPLIHKNLRWLNIIPGIYVDFYGNDIFINENNPDHIRDSIAYIPKINPTPFIEELIVFPLHFKYLMQERLYPEQKPLVSKLRYLVVLEQWIPKTKAQVAWRDLGIQYCKNNQCKISESVTSYRDLQLSLDFEERDINFLFSYAIITNTYHKEIFTFPNFKDSYVIPLISLSMDFECVQEFFLESTSRESWIRALFYYDFTHSHFQDKLAKKILTDFTEEEYSHYFEFFHPSLYSALFYSILEIRDEKKLIKLLSKFNNWESLLKNINLVSLIKSDSKLVNTLLEKSMDSFIWNTVDIVLLLKELPDDASFVSSALRILEKNSEKNSDKNSELISLLFDLWIDNKKINQDSVAEKYFDKFSFFIGNKNPFFAEEELRLDNLQKQLMSLLSSTDSKISKCAEDFINAHVSPRGIKLESLTKNFSLDEVQGVFINILKKSQFPVTKNIANSFVSAMIELKDVSLENLQGLLSEMPFIEDQYRNLLEYRIKERLPKKEAVNESSKENDVFAAQKEIEELKRKMSQMEQEKKNTEERDRIVNEAKDKSTRYQIKLAELQSWYQIEMSKIMMGPLSPEEKGKKIAEISEQYSNSMIELNKILTD